MDMAGGLSVNASIGVQNVSPVSEAGDSLPGPVDNEFCLVEQSEDSFVFPLWIRGYL